MTKFIQNILTHRFYPSVVLILLAIPQFFSPPVINPKLETSKWIHPWFGAITLPRVFAGDEPHYLVQMNSLIKDFSFDLRKGYERAFNGSVDAGSRHRGNILDHHTAWDYNGGHHLWVEVYDFFHPYLDSSGIAKYPLLPGAPQNLVDLPEHTWHPMAFSFILSPVVFWFRNTDLVEATALLCTLFISWAGFLVFRRLLLHFIQDPPLTHILATMTFLGSPLWHYSRTLFTEPYIAFFVILFITLLTLYKNDYFLGKFLGCLSLAFAMMLKPVAVLFLFPFVLQDFLNVWRQSQGMTFLRMLFQFIKHTTPYLGGIFLYLIYFFVSNKIVTDSFFTLSQPAPDSGDFFTGLIGFIFSPAHGLFPYTPILLLAIGGWYRFLRTSSSHFDSWPILMGGLLYFLFFCCIFTWHGANSYGPRYLVPCLPAFFMGLIPAFTTKNKKGIIKIPNLVYALGFTSVVINFAGVFPHFQSWDKHPFYAIYLYLNK